MPWWLRVTIISSLNWRWRVSICRWRWEVASFGYFFWASTIFDEHRLLDIMWIYHLSIANFFFDVSTFSLWYKSWYRYLVIDQKIIFLCFEEKKRKALLVLIYILMLFIVFPRNTATDLTMFESNCNYFVVITGCGKMVTHGSFLKS